MAINHWLQNTRGAARNQPSWRNLRMLVMLFQALGARGIPPFASRQVRWIDLPSPPLDWTKLPTKLRYVAEAAELYGHIQFDDEIEAFGTSITIDQRKELERLAERARDDLPLFMKWVGQFRMTEHQEAARVHFLFTLMNRLGIW